VNTLLERQRELAAIDAAVSAASAGSGHCIAFEAHAGIGKTRLLEAARERAERAGVRVLTARCDEFEQEFGWAMAGSLFEPALRSPRGRERQALLARAGPAGPALLEPEREAESSRAVVHGLFSLAAGVAEQAPTMLLVDDLHWADLPSLRFLLYLVQRLDELPLSVVVALRPVRAGPARDLLDRILDHASCRVLEPAPLGPAAVSTIVRRELSDGASDPLCATCAGVTGGNPFYLHELLTTLRAEHPDPGALDPEHVRSIVPASIIRSMLVRIGRLPAGAVQVARAVAVLGSAATMACVSRLANLDAADIDAAIDGLAAAGLLTPSHVLCFVHAIVGSAVYSDIPPRERAAMHLHAARLLDAHGSDPRVVAAHLLNASTRGDAWVVERLGQAAEDALARAAPEAAVTYLRRALDEPPPNHARAELLVALGRADAAAGNERAEQRFAEALRLIDEPGRRAEITLMRGRELQARGRHEEAAAAFERGLAELPEGSNEETVKELRAAYVTASTLIGPLEPHALEQLEAIVGETDDPTPGERALLAQLALQDSMAASPRSQVRALACRAWADGALLGGETAQGGSWPLVTGALLFVDELELELDICEAAIADAIARGLPLAVATARYCRSAPLYHMGHIEEAIADLESALDARRYGWEEYVGAALAFLALCLIERGEYEEAHAALSIMDEPGMEESFQYLFLMEAKGRLALMEADARRAVDVFLEAGRLREEVFGIRTPGFCLWRSGAALGLHALGETEEARRLLAELTEVARHVDAPRLIGNALITRGLIEAGDRSLQALDEAVELLEHARPRLEYVRALVEQGAARRRAGKRAAAKESLRRALDLAERGGATRLARQARDELAALGLRPRTTALTGPEALTPSELRVATMAADGRSNPEIAQALFVTRKAVEWHLGNAYRKLGIRSRRELSTALEPERAAT
jgi:DNA-binding CsgD family transcriptional regulator